ncbi:MAG: pilin [bacterium]
MNMKKFFSTIFLAVALFLTTASPVLADDICSDAKAKTSIYCSLVKDIPCMATGSCGSLDSILQVFATLSQWMLGIAGSVMLLMFVWGGAEWVFSSGGEKLISSGKSKMTNAMIGIVLMFGALAVVRSIRIGLLGADNKIVECVVDADCNAGKECTETDGKSSCSKLCSGGQCISSDVAMGQRNAGLGSCDKDEDCQVGTTQPWMACLASIGTGKRCVTKCVSLKKGVCQSPASSATQPCGSPSVTKATEANLCNDGQICCIP